MRRLVPFLAALLVGAVVVGGCSNQHKTSRAEQTFAKATISDKPSPAAVKLLPADIRKRGSVNIAINPDVPPVKFLDSNNQVQGLIVELLRHAGARLGLKVTFQQTSFDALIPGLVAKRYDVIASEGDFKEREKKVDYIDYMKSGVSLLVKKGNPRDIHGPNDLCGTKVAFVRGTFQQNLIAEASKKCKAAGKPAVESNGYQDSAGAELALRSGQADADWADSPDGAYRAKQNPDKYVLANTIYTGPYGIGFPKNEPGLTRAFRAALLGTAKDETYQKAMKKYGLANALMPTFPLNDGPRQTA